MPANGRWLKSLSELKVVPDAEFAAAVESLIAANPQARARKIASGRQRFSNLLQDTLHVAARLLAFEKRILPVHIGGGDPAAKTPDGRSAVGWAINARQGQFTMFVLDDAVLLCEQYLADGRKITHELMDEVRSALSSNKPNLDVLKGFERKVWKEIARIPPALVEEAKAVAKDGNVLAAAEIACARLQDELLDLHALTKTNEGRWCFAIWAKNGQYLMDVFEKGMIISSPAAGTAKTEPFVVRLDEIHRYNAANAGGRA